MIIDGEAVTEVPALLTYVASLKPEAGLTPPQGTLAYARCFEWLGFLSSSLHVAYAQFRRPQRFLAEGSPGWDELSDQGRLNTIRFYREVERRLSDGWAAGKRLFDRRHQPVSVLHLGVAARVRHAQGMPEMGFIVRSIEGAAGGSASGRTRGNYRLAANDRISAKAGATQACRWGRRTKSHLED